MFFFFFDEYSDLPGNPLPDSSQNTNESLFESIKHTNEYGQEFWYARELQAALEYTEWRNFKKVIEKAKTACMGSENDVLNHFVDVNKMVNMSSGSEREIENLQLSRYACYLIVQNGDPRKKVIAIGQTYFAVKTRQQELIENYDNPSEDNKRLSIRNEMKVHNKSLAEAAQQAGITESKDYAIFQNKGYQGLYGGLTRKDIHKRKGLKKARTFLILWVAPNLPLISSGQHRLTKNSEGNILPEKTLRTKRITKLERRFGILSGISAVPCLRICQPPPRA